ncbi:hypothetical protein [Vibrio sp. 10N.261.51.F12]|uniref:hypothetical protein n=1 Tax=Vibrio sp. 10N.261.51.F12 TaxID=3229679 RepID=UPI003551C0F8
MKLKTLSTLIAVAMTAGTLTGCNFYDEPPGGEVPEEPTTPPPIEDVDTIVESVSELAAAIQSAEHGAVIGLKAGGDFASIGTLILTKPITLTSVDADGNLSDDGVDQAVITGATCIDVPSTADSILKGTTGIRLSNLSFDNVTLDTCGSEDTSRSVINVGKVGDGDTPVVLEKLTFNGMNFTESTSSPTAWVYSRGLVDIQDSEFLNKQVDNTTTGILYLNCGSNKINGGSARNSSPVFTNNTVELTGDSAALNGIVAGQFDGKACGAVVTGNLFTGFANDVSTDADTFAAIVDGDTTGGNKIEGNDFGEGSTPPPTDPDSDVDVLNESIQAASVGQVISLGADKDYSEGIIELSKEVILDGENLATITGSACINISAAGAEVKNLSFKNNAITSCASGESSQGRSGSITIMQVGEENKPVLLTNLHIDAQDITNDMLENKASLIYSSGYFELLNSTFVNLQSNIQNNAVYTPCHKLEARMGSVIQGNNFAINDAGNSEVAAIKFGNSSSGAIQDNTYNNSCLVTIENNVFTGYSVNVTDSVGSSSDNPRVAAVFARNEAMQNDVENTNTFQ